MIARWRRWWSRHTVAQRRRWLGVAVGLISGTAFLGSLGGQFLWDDYPLILHNRYMTTEGQLPRLLTEGVLSGNGYPDNRYRPVELLSHFMDTRLWGFQPFGHHLTSLLIHVAGAVAVFRLLATLVPVGAAAVAALIFSLHPLQTLVVPIVSGRADPLVLLWICLGLLAFPKHPGWSLLCAALAMGSKETGALFPAFLFLYNRAVPHPKPLTRQLPFWLLLELYVTLRLGVLDFHDTLNTLGRDHAFSQQFSYRLFTYFSSVFKGLSLCVWPWDVHLFRSWPAVDSLMAPPALAGAALMSAMGAGIAAWWRTRPVIAGGLAWFLVGTLPTSNLAAVLYMQFSDHWYILPGLGLVVAAASAAADACRRAASSRALLWAASGVAAAALAAAAPAYVRVWQTPLSLFGSIAAHEPRSGRAQYHLGGALVEDGRIAEAIPVLQRSIELGYDDVKPRHALAMCYLASGRGEDAIEQLRHVVRLVPGNRWPRLTLAKVLRGRGRLPEARDVIEAGLAVRAGDPELLAFRRELETNAGGPPGGVR